MKKLIAISILLTVLATAAFAQLKVGLTADFFPELMKATAPLDDSADPNKGSSYQGQGTFDFMSSGAYTGKNNELRLKLEYTDPDKNYGGQIRFRFDSVIQRAAANASKDGSVFENPSTDAKVSADTFWSRPIDDYSIWGKIGKITAEFGDLADRGQTTNFRFDSGFDWIVDAQKQDNFGILYANPRGSDWAKADINNLQATPPIITGTKPLYNSGISYVKTTVDFAPFFVQLSGGVLEIPEAVNDPKVSYSKGNAGIRVSGAGLLDGKITFDATYKIRGADPNTDTNKDGIGKGGQPGDPLGAWNHAFGVYAGLKVIDNLGLSVGYSGAVQAKESGYEGGKDIKYVYPFVSGIDLRAQFTGIEKLTITFNNNLSFAYTEGKADGTTVTGLFSPSLGDSQKEGYFAMYNGLGAAYKVTDAFTGKVQIINRWASLTNDNPGRKDVYDKDQLRIALSGTYTATSHVELGAGLDFGIDHSTYKPGTGIGSKTGAFTFAVPLRLKVVY
ncbi:hypothetical protein AGMMS50268_33580 [Spirochaetia bacterium]|nr:hypothetical protein AGMMS50268_33580 [Spirochaetia bacterium]